MTLPSDTARSLCALCQHLRWFSSLAADRASQMVLATHSSWSPELYNGAAEEVLEAIRNPFFDLLTSIGGRVALATTAAGESEIRDTVLFRWYAPERTVHLFTEVDPTSRLGYLVANLLCVLAKHQLHSLRLHSLRGRNLERWTSEDTGFLENVSMLPKFYHQFGVFGWASYFEQVALAHQDGYLEEFLVLSPFGNRAWVSPKPYEWETLSPDALLELVRQIADAVEMALTSALGRPESSSLIEKMILDITSSVVLSVSPTCFVNLLRSFNEQPDAGQTKAHLVIDAYERIRVVHLKAIGRLTSTERTQ